jgi:membrane protease YdiL (CAAX protease family)
MATASVADSNPLAKVPRWQVLAILVGGPLVYIANSFTPWSYGLFYQQDHSHWLAFATSIIALHWASVLLSLWFLWRSGARLADIGFDFTPVTLAVFIAVVVGAGAGLIFLRQTWPAATQLGERWQLIYPWTMPERVLGIAMYMSAGVCEELVYRGWAIRVLQARGFRTWQAGSLAAISFALMHGLFGVILFPVHFVAAVMFSLLFVWTKRLSPGMYLHALFDMMCLLAI